MLVVLTQRELPDLCSRSASSPRREVRDRAAAARAAHRRQAREHGRLLHRPRRSRGVRRRPAPARRPGVVVDVDGTRWAARRHRTASRSGSAAASASRSVSGGTSSTSTPAPTSSPWVRRTRCCATRSGARPGLHARPVRLRTRRSTCRCGPTGHRARAVLDGDVVRFAEPVAAGGAGPGRRPLRGDELVGGGSRRDPGSALVSAAVGRIGCSCRAAVGRIGGQGAMGMRRWVASTRRSPERWVARQRRVVRTESAPLRPRTDRNTSAGLSSASESPPRLAPSPEVEHVVALGDGPRRGGQRATMCSTGNRTGSDSVSGSTTTNPAGTRTANRCATARAAPAREERDRDSDQDHGDGAEHPLLVGEEQRSGGDRGAQEEAGERQRREGTAPAGPAAGSAARRRRRSRSRRGTPPRAGTRAPGRRGWPPPRLRRRRCRRRSPPRSRLPARGSRGRSPGRR